MHLVIFLLSVREYDKQSYSYKILSTYRVKWTKEGILSSIPLHVYILCHLSYPDMDGSLFHMTPITKILHWKDKSQDSPWNIYPHQVLLTSFCTFLTTI